MTSIREARRRVEEEIANARVPPQDNQASPQEQVPLGGKAPVDPLLFSNGKIRAAFLNMTFGK